MPKDNDLTTLDTIRAPIEHARGLPNAHYTDAATIAVESEAVLAKQWAGIGVGADVPEPGDAKPIEFLGEPLLLLRDDNGALRVFHNVCRHRGMVLVDQARKIEGAIRCPYHSWCYAKDGRLVATPHVGGPGQNAHDAIDRKSLGLLEVRSHVWRDVVFVNLSGDAAGFEQVQADLIARWAEFDQPLYHGGENSTFTLRANTNWKLAIENFCEAYHLPWVHPGLNSYSRLEDHYNIEAPGRYAGQGTDVYRQIECENGTRFPDFKDLSPVWNTAAEYIAVFPNVLLAVHRDHTFTMIIDPVAKDRTEEHVHLYYAQPDTDPELRAENARRWQDVLEEDIAVVEGMQRGRACRGFDGGRFSPAMDGPTHVFHAWVAGCLADDAG
ncbi:MAG: aromatic ring-hydroxylating dioxygenase subunit alpha [Pseudomonadota bacterium]